MTQVTIDVPQGLEDRFLARAQQLLCEIETEAEREEELRRVATDDQAMLDYLDRRCLGAKNKEFPPVVRASTYGGVVDGRQELRGTWSMGDQRPVLMRGSIEAMAGKYTRKSAMADLIADRFLRRIKFTALTNEPAREMDVWLCRRLEQNGWYVHQSPLGSRLPGLYGDDARIWRGGEWIRMPAEEYAEALRAANSRDAARVRRAAREQKAKKQYLEWIEAKSERDRKRREAADQRQQQRDNERRKRRAAEIAAYELLSEIGATECPI